MITNKKLIPLNFKRCIFISLTHFQFNAVILQFDDYLIAETVKSYLYGYFNDSNIYLCEHIVNLTSINVKHCISDIVLYNRGLSLVRSMLSKGSANLGQHASLIILWGF